MNDLGHRLTAAFDSPSVRHATWLGPERTPLSAVIDTPAGGLCRGAVVVCPPIGKEHVDAYRALVALAQKFATKGLLVVRFDYRGTGDSAGEQDDPAAVTGWLDSIVAAVEYVRAAGIEEITLLGLRVGALLAARAAAACGPVHSMVLWDPVVHGRGYLRRSGSLYRLAVSEETGDGRVSIVGAVLHPDAAHALSDLDMRRIRRTQPFPVLMGVRDTEIGRADVQHVIGEWDAEHVVVHEYDLFLEPTDFAVRIPFADLDTIATWVSAHHGRRWCVPALQLRDSAVVGHADDGTAVVETFCRIGPHRLFAIRTQSAIDTHSSTFTPRPTLVLHATAAEHRIGPVRLWVDTARTLARYGVDSVRFDRRGAGDTGIVPDGEHTTLYTDESKEDALAVAEVAAHTGPAVHVGMCSGGWHAAYAALHHETRSVVMINMLDWALVRRVAVRQATLAASTDHSTVTAMVWRVLHRHADTVKAALRVAVPYPGWMWLARRGLLQVPEVLLSALHRRGVDTTVLLSPDDYAAFVDNHGTESVDRLRRRGWTGEIRTYPAGDHSLYSTGLREQVGQDLIARIVQTVGIRAEVQAESR
ncbi:serine aminopeptidase domain-containing protein [Rhodococcus sp. O3]|uniref:serine aminopeptidase domain-containing protein n=1 Tax=Rhodococcus sp. O3 TaxID=3404919 RepID=UPI003B677B1E